jgi:glycine/D-amino acid oxidase-like deaminating enzyme
MVVIGGGVTDCSVAWHLVLRGLTDTVLSERQRPTSGSSWHAAGSLFTPTQPHPNAILQKYTRDIFPVVEAESDQRSATIVLAVTRLP